MEKDLKDVIVPKIQSACSALISKKHSRISLSDFTSIEKKKVGNAFFFYNNVYANKYLEFFNEEEFTDYLMFEKNKVFIDYSDNLFTFHKIDEQEKILEVDLDNQEIKTKENKTDEEDNGSHEMEANKTDVITLSYFPLCISHCNICLCYDQDLSQVLSTELLIQTLQLYFLTQNSTLVLGYDSFNAGCVINHLHFEFLMMDDFGDVNHLPISDRETKLLLCTQLKHKNKEEISMFDGTSLIKISITYFPVCCWKLEAIINQEDNGDITDMNNCFQNSISHVANMILSKLIDKERPHNLIIASQGTVFYIIPRNPETKEQPFNTCWNDLAGLVTFKTKKDYDTYTEDMVNQFIKNNISWNEKEFNEMTEEIFKQIDSVYEIQQ